MHFVALDGEGVNTLDNDGDIIDHRYGLLSATGRDPLYKNGERLTTQEIFHYLYYVVFLKTEAEHSGAVYCGFSLGYDFSQWFKDLPPHQAWSLLHKKGIKARERRAERLPPFPVYFRVSPDLEWEFDMLGDNKSRLRPYTGKQQRGPGIKIQNDNQWMHICDAFSFFQTSFLNVMDPNERIKCNLKPYLTPEEYEKITEGKENRAAAQFNDKMIEYNRIENKALSAVMVEMNHGLVQSGVRLKKHQYFGPGQAAQKWLDSVSDKIKLTEVDPHTGKEKTRTIPTLGGEHTRMVVPEWIREMPRKGYFGGWFEIFYHGIYKGTSHGYDINSAYPEVMRKLPCLLHGHYLRGKGIPYKDERLTGKTFGAEVNKVICFVHATVRGSHPRIGAMLHRTKGGNILRPHRSRGWFCLHEIEAAQRAGLIDSVDFVEWGAYIPCDCPPPLQKLEKLYQGRIGPDNLTEDERKQLKSSPEGVAKKLIYNSCYGKFCQSIGEPKYGNAVYACLITAGCRTMILDFIATHPKGANAVLMIATDGVVTTEPHPWVEISKTQLGAWDHKTHDDICLYKPGTYWDNIARENIKADKLGNVKMKTRGVPVKALVKRILEIDDVFLNWRPGDGWPTFPLILDFALISPTQAVARSKWNERGQPIGKSKWHLCGRVRNQVPGYNIFGP
jgi:hypothetical protein